MREACFNCNCECSFDLYRTIMIDIAEHECILSLTASNELCRLLITFANSFYPDRARQIVRPDPDFEKKSADDKKS